MFDHQLKIRISELAQTYNIEPAALLAIVDVESGGRTGVRVNGRTEPLIRFEGHYFYRLLPQMKRNLAVVRGIASPKAGHVKNPRRQSARWKLLNRAEAIDRHAALASCSWGCGQVMGAHWRWLDYASIDALVAEARDGVEGQIRLMMRYVQQAGLISKLQNLDWAGFARAYNGPAYRKYRYDQKMQVAYEDYCPRIGRLGRRNLLSPRNTMSILRLGSFGDAVRKLQQDLSGLGYLLITDGDFGPATERALKKFQAECGLQSDGIFGVQTMEMMQRRLPSHV